MKFALIILILGLFFNFVIAYDQDNTHPALTDEIVDFYNLSYPEDSISDEFKKELIRGSVEEDVLPRPFNHFYDPIYNKGFGGNYSSKEWARNSENQVVYYLRQTTGFAGFVKPPGAENHPADYSYERAIRDYAIGNKTRAFQALGHVLHLLEDANVPDHSRDDPHPPIHGFGSPYETIMARWNVLNTNIAKPLFDNKIKSIVLNNIDKYFDEVALYSNNNFFSEDTIFIERYKKPEVDLWEYKLIGKKLVKVGYKVSNNDKYILTRERIALETRNFLQETSWTIDDIGILNDYWDRLSNHLIPHGAGVVKLFLEQARAAEKLYAERKVEEPRMTLLQKIIGAINPFDDEMEKAEAQNEQIVSEIASGILDGKIEVNIEQEPRPETNILVFRNVGISQSPGLSPVGFSNPIATLIPTLSLTPTISPTPTPSVLPSPTLTPTPTPSATPSSTPAATTENNSCAEPVLKTNDPLRQVIINEIAWMGTDASTADEWLELKNNSTGEIDFNCWQLVAEDGTPKIKMTSKISASGYYFLERTDDNTVKDITADQTYTGALGNSGEILKLYDKDGNLQDVVGHKDASGAVVPWYAGDNTTKSSMERRNPNASGAESSSWHTNDGITKNGTDAGGNSIKGTPKNQNSTGTVGLGSSGGGSSSSSSSSSGDSGGGSEDGGEEGGNINTPLFKIVINEIAWAGTGADTNDEWIELYNPTSQSVNLGSWILKASGSFTVNLATVSFNPFGYFLLERTDDTAISDIVADQIYTGAMNNSGEILELRDNTGQLQDKVDAWHAGENNTSTAPPTRKTMERIGTGWQTNNGIIRNGLDKDGNLLFGTPKKKNSQ